MANHETLLSLEFSRAQDIPSTPDDSRHNAIPLPSAVAGLRILDIGAGLSTLDMDLAKQGAQVIMLDRKYNNLPALKWDAKKYTREFTRSLSYRHAKLATPQKVAATRLAMEKLIDTFSKRLKKEPQNMVAGMAGNLPFKSDIFDLVYSQNLIAPGLLYYVDVAENAIDEALRVTKPGGQVIVGPLEIYGEDAEPLLLQNGYELISRMRKKYELVNLKSAASPVNTALNHSVLEIIKPS